MGGAIMDNVEQLCNCQMCDYCQRMEEYHNGEIDDIKYDSFNDYEMESK